MTPEERKKMLSEISEQTRKLAIPIDYNDLEKKGIITKSGAWYRVSDLNALPEHARLKMTSFTNDSKGLKVKFSKSTAFEKHAKKFDTLGL